MKRFFYVLAIVLVLIVSAWDDASSRRYPEVRIDEPVYDHPWGGDQNNPEQPINFSTSTSDEFDLTFFEIIKSWNYRYFFYGSTFFNAHDRSNTTTTTTTTTVTDPGADESAPSSQGGLGQ